MLDADRAIVQQRQLAKSGCVLSEAPPRDARPTTSPRSDRARPLDGINQLLIEGKVSERRQSLGFWNNPNNGKGMASGGILQHLKKADPDGVMRRLTCDCE